MPRYKVTLTEKERNELTTKYTKGKHSAHAVLSARALVLLDAGDGGPAKSNKEVSEATGLSLRTLDNLKRTFVEEGLEAALDRNARRGMQDGRSGFCATSLSSLGLSSQSRP